MLTLMMMRILNAGTYFFKFFLFILICTYMYIIFSPNLSLLDTDTEHTAHSSPAPDIVSSGASSPHSKATHTRTPGNKRRRKNDDDLIIQTLKEIMECRSEREMERQRKEGRGYSNRKRRYLRF